MTFKKFFVLLTGIILLIPSVVSAGSLSVDDVFNLLSEESTINIPSIDVEHFIDENYCTLMGFNEEDCIKDTATLLVKAYINNKLESIREDNPEITYFVDSCDSKNSCSIFVKKWDGVTNPEETRTFTINYTEEYNETKYNYVKNYTDKIKKEYSLFDLSYINELNNYLHGTNVILNNIHVLRVYPELKEIIENNPRLELMVGLNSAGGSPYYDDNNGSIFVAYDGIIYGAKINMTFRIDKIIFVSDETANTNESFADAARNRIVNFINDSTREITVSYNEESTDLIFDNEYKLFEEIETFVNNRLNLTNAKVVGMYDLYIDLPLGEGMGESTTESIAIVTIPKEVLEELNVTIQSFDFENGIIMYTGSSSVPLDTSITSENVINSDYVKNALKDDDSVLVAAYDLNLYSILNKKYINSIKEGVEVLIPISNDYDGDTLKIYYITDDGEKGEEFICSVVTIDGQKYVKFTTNHFSTYAILKTNSVEKVENNVSNPETYDGILGYAGLGIISLFGLFTIIFYENRTKIRKVN